MAKLTAQPDIPLQISTDIHNLPKPEMAATWITRMQTTDDTDDHGKVLQMHLRPVIVPHVEQKRVATRLR